MSKQEIIRAWKDETYRKSLSAEQRAALPENPAGVIDLTDADMEAIVGGCPYGHAVPRTIHLSCWDPDCGFAVATRPDFSPPAVAKLSL